MFCYGVDGKQVDVDFWINDVGNNKFSSFSIGSQSAMTTSSCCELPSKVFVIFFVKKHNRSCNEEKEYEIYENQGRCP